MGKKVIIGMSGGVDSSVSAYLLKKAGYDVIGVTMHTWQDGNIKDKMINPLCVEDAMAVAKILDIPYYVVDFRKQFKCNVVDYFINDYFDGLTPNPCNTCNRTIKWEALMGKGEELGAQYIATGHYAKIELRDNGRYAIKCASSEGKDQTYALYNLTQDQLSKTIMPIGQYQKEEIRKIAREIGLNVADKADSQDICFIPNGDYGSFIKAHSDKIAKEGNFVDKEGNVLGRHKGIIHYTIGQRKGLGIALGHPVFVTGIDKKKNQIIIGENEDLFVTKVRACNINFMGVDSIEDRKRFLGKIRYSHKKSQCTAFYKDGILTCEFDEPVRAATPGQALVLYDGEYVACGGTIL